MKTKLSAVLSVLMFALLFTATPVFAAEVDVEAENNTTGAYSENENEVDVDNDLDKDIDNDADVYNKAHAKVNTGENEQNKNTEGGDIDTGSVDASTDWASVLNAGATFAGVENGELDVDADFSNDTTGADSENENELDVDNDIDLDVRNDAWVLNYLGLYANTGKNEQNKNTEAGDTTTGDISLDALISNYANNDAGFAGAHGGSVAVDFSGDNHKTGYDSENENEVDVDNDYDLDVNNDADLKNIIRVYANTGKNEQNKNTTGGDIKTGDVAVTTDILNSANNGAGAYASSGSSLDVEVDASNDTTGADSENENKVDVDNDTDIDINNDADVENKIEVKANTGENEQNKNTEGGSTSTGDVTLDFVLTNEVNSN